MKKWLLLTLLVATASAHDMGVGTDLAAEAGLFPSFDEVRTAMAAAGQHPNIQLFTVGQTASGDPVEVAEIVIGDAPREERTTTFLMTQQHGNEPAGTPAALQILANVQAGELDDVLASQVLLVLPMANPDGATANSRANKDGMDINRDHIGLETDEARAIHAVLNQWDVHVAVDHHEYGGTGIGYPSPVRFYDFDLTTMFPNHGNVAPDVRAMAESLIYDGVWPHMQAQGYSTGDYGVQTVAGIPVQQTAGGPDPGILRNAFGLNNVIGFLAESYVGLDANPLHDAARREAIHLETMLATLQYVADNGPAIQSAKLAAASANQAKLMPQYVEGDSQAALPEAFMGANVDDLMALHGLPMGHPGEDGTVYNMLHERQGLLAAILAPASSRAVGPYEATDAFSSPAAAESEETPAVLGLACLGLAALVCRRNQ
ncbi:MAG: M14 family zinc carboxypeptidase [Thermoplasmatota archaeon]